MGKRILHLFIFIVLLASSGQARSAGVYGFRRIGVGDGLSNSQVNCIYKDRSGFVWFGTGMGLGRFDGFRFHNFYQNSADSTSLMSNLVTQITGMADGKMWIHTDEGYCIYDPATESFDRHPERWMQRNGMKGYPEYVFADHKGNLVIMVSGRGCWYKNLSSGHGVFFPYGKGKGRIPRGTVSDITEQGKSLVLTYNNGLLVRIDPAAERVVWVNDWPRRVLNGNGNAGYFTFIDRHYNYYVNTNGHSFVYSSLARRWFTDIVEFLTFSGITCRQSHILVKNMKEDGDGNLWIATEHSGFFCVNIERRTCEAYTYDPANPLSLPDNTLQCVCVDNDNAVWAGTLRNGAVYWSPAQKRFATIPSGDICTMAEDKSGRIWMGTNDSGIKCYDPKTGVTRSYSSRETGLGSDVVVSSLCSRDGTLWFGTYNGGITYYRDGRFTAVKSTPGGLASNSVWSVGEDLKGNIVIGTLGAGLQLLDRSTMRFTTYSVNNSRLASDFIASIYVCHDGTILLGHSHNFSRIDTSTGQITNYPATKAGKPFSSRSVNQVMQDSRGLIWCANMSGLNVYDPRTDSVYTLTDNSQMACSVTEDKRGDVWVALSHGVTRFTVTQDSKGWNFFSASFDDLDGLQGRRFNYRSILTTAKGEIIVGGQDGVNIINPVVLTAKVVRAKAVFSGLILFDHPLNVDETFGGRVVLERSISTVGELRLKYSEKAFTILLSSDHVCVPQKVRFQYRLEGFNDDQWLVTADGQPAVTFTNLSPGRYQLLVRVVNRDGTVSPETSRLSVVIEPPFWLTKWAFAVYALLVCAVVWAVWRITIHRQLVRMRIEQIKKEAERNRQLDEMKLSFFANVSHELRTPLTLIISPVRALLAKETDKSKRTLYGMILRSANRLLDLVNQTLDLRRIEKKRAGLNLGNGDVVSLTSEICRTFKTLSGRGVDIVFTSGMESLPMSFDEDKMEKIITNLISNALKFTPDGGRISVGVALKKASDEGGKNGNSLFVLTVADTGSGISDKDKEHIFDRFYQARNSGGRMVGGSGIGLNLVKEFALLHGGDVTVADNEGGGTVFTVFMPYRYDPSLPEISHDIVEEQTVNPAEQGVLYAGNEPKGEENLSISTMNSLLKKGEYEVLVVDDNTDFLEFMETQLSEIYKVRTAVNGREALRSIAERKPDVILSDVMMPEMDGNELCRVLKSNPKTERIPFIMLTARLSSEYKVEGMTNGADDYITKPFNFDLLNLRIANLIKWRNATPIGEKVVPEIRNEEITSVDESFVRQATEYVEDNLTDPELSVEAMAETLSMSRVHLYKRLLSITGSTPTEFIRSIRLRHAARLLCDGQFNVSEVAYKVGFNNPRYFSKYFKEMYGVMPSQYRKEAPDKTHGPADM